MVANACEKCLVCGKVSFTVERRRSRTNYVDDERNHLISCQECFDEGEIYWAAQWEDYYGLRARIEKEKGKCEGE